MRYLVSMPAIVACLVAVLAALFAIFQLQEYVLAFVASARQHEAEASAADQQEVRRALHD